ncbi:hypothetical protein HanXRQr2_Chr16g0730861 [Helianthus annuus]|uniref:Uncharacterized protein n=1 Tax=Helianthus annuus TaxID=4232 RepID=A0A9K3DQP8_HELAN|nr:hypothetical protein HanXRQr2_Chr16g0730861 [Helianthus annuus]KAJ0436901.1 hypothetical protein HanHA300_Chr16g0595841 [Helianthus annuus]KAJ0441185.1 hypothetical protein HanIR_Chr16g0794821 [Helianthus annuus]
MLNLNSPLCLHRLERKHLLGFLRRLQERSKNNLLLLHWLWNNCGRRKMNG